MKLRLALLTVFLVISPRCFAQQVNPALDPLAFLSGRWIEVSPDGWEEEYWSHIEAGSMVGHFRVVKDGVPEFYEFWAIEVEDGKPVFKMKHFSRGLLGWEDKAEMVRLASNAGPGQQVVFSKPDGSLSLRYERKGDELISTLHRMKDGKAIEDVFHLHHASD